MTDAGSGLLAIGSQFAGYLVEGVAGHGGMGVVYRARQLRPSRTVALKVISPALASDPEFRERFAHESELAASIENSNVIPVYEVGEESDLLYIVMRFVDGTDLRTILKAEGRLEPKRALEILSGLTGALDAAHAHGLVHRDVKPGNILIAREGDRDHVYLTDFGLAKLSSGGSRTRTGMFIGTLDYAAPEQIEGGNVDARTDVYSVGCLLYEMLTGTVPFAKDHEAAIMWAHISSEPPSARDAVPSLPPKIDAVIARAMAKNPDDRYSSAGDLARAAGAAFAGENATLTERSVATGLAAPVGAPSSPPEFLAEPGLPKRHSGLTVAGSAIAALVLVGIVLAVSGVFSSSGNANHGTTTTRAQASSSSTAVSSLNTYINTKAGISFQYPSQWQQLTLKGTLVDFGTGSGTAETRCALEVQRGAGPRSSSQEARFAFVRNRSQIAARESKNYQLKAIQAEPAVNTTGVGLIRVADRQGGHLGFFFQGQDVYIFDCITPAAQLDQVSKQEFEPLLRSFAFT